MKRKTHMNNKILEAGYMAEISEWAIPWILFLVLKFWQGVLGFELRALHL
jgi:hypothetical protein